VERESEQGRLRGHDGGEAATAVGDAMRMRMHSNASTEYDHFVSCSLENARLSGVSCYLWFIHDHRRSIGRLK
jgi:hypothetical protein